MFENQIIFGGIYRSKDINRTWSHASHADLRLNNQRYNLWIPIKFSGNDCVKPGIYMIDTYQAPYFNTKHYAFEKLVENMISYGENGDSAYYNCGNYYYNSRVRLTDEVFEEFELIADLREWREIPLSETYQYADVDVLHYIKLYHEHQYPDGICLIKKDAQVNRWNQVEDWCNTVLDNICRPSIGYSASRAIEELQKLQSNENVNIRRVRSVVELYNYIKELAANCKEVYDRLYSSLSTTRYEWLQEESENVDV